jgi:hydroxyacylglutathione hydrolase
MSTLEIEMFPCLSDNYGFLIHDDEQGLTASIDTPDVPAIEAALERRSWRLTHVFNTHHHMDHAGGNLELKARTHCEIVGPRSDAGRIPGIDRQVGDGDTFAFGSQRVDVLETPGHTRGHVVYYLPRAKAAFVGDTLFAMGCGRLFEGTPDQMWNSLQKLLRWPDDTKIYCAHEYTAQNGRFALTVEPDNQALRERVAEVERLRAENVPTVPTTLALEKATNPFLRVWSRHLRETIGLPDGNDVNVFARTRALKDAFS